jgi:hypothetical protein
LSGSRFASQPARFALLASLSPLVAPADPAVDLLLPRGGQRGTEVAVEFHGARLADAEGVLFAAPGLDVLELAAVDEGRVRARFRIAPDCRLGEQTLRLRTRTGLSRLLTFWVGPFRTVDEIEPNQDHGSAQPIAANVTLHGTIGNEDVDCFVVEAKAGQRLSVEVEALRLGDAPFDAFVSLQDERRFELASCDDSTLFRQDPVLSAVAPADGRYFVVVRDSSFGGSDRSRYRLHVGGFPRPLALWPAGGRQGTTLDVELRGDAAGARMQPLAIPDPPPPDFMVWPEDAGIPAPSGLPFRIRSFGSVAEVEPNADLAQATRFEAEVPVAFDGVIETNGDVDWYRFGLKKDVRMNIRLAARQQRSPLDPVMTIHASDGQQLDASDDTIGLDSYIAFTAPSDGEYAVRVFDHLRAGSPLHTYRLEIFPTTPSVALDVPRFGRDTQARQVVNVPRGGRAAAVIHASRNQWSGPLALTASDLPDGVVCTAVPMGRSVDTTLLLFEAAPDAVLDARFVDVVGESEEPKVRGRLRQRFNLVVVAPNETSLCDTDSDRLPVAVVEAAPFALEVAVPKVPLVHFGQMALPVTVHRREGFDGPVTLRLLGAHAGINAQPTIEVPKGQAQATYFLNAGGEAEVRRHVVAIQGEAESGRGVVLASTGALEFDVAAPFLGVKLDLAAVEQGQQAQVVAHVTPAVPFAGKAKVSLRGLPAQATTVDLECESGAESTLVFDVATTKETPVGKHTTLFCQVVVEQGGEPIVHFLGGGGTLRVDPPAPPATAAAAPAPEPTPAPAAPVAPAAEPPKKPLSRLEQLREEARKRADAANGGGR